MCNWFKHLQHHDELRAQKICQVNEGNSFGLVENADETVTGQHKPNNTGDPVTGALNLDGGQKN